ncbi:MAG: prepilin-type N-terminal cleavage/methylation domain-containing protein [Candidatus Gracilibacteria bacterium]
MKKFAFKKPAFTLLELLIVITIAGILTSVLVMNFSGVKERQELALLADQSVAMLQKAKADVRAGKINDVGYLCEGALFEVGEAPVFITTNYDSAQSLCDIDSFVSEQYGISGGDSTVTSIEAGGLATSRLYVFFSPKDDFFKFYNDSESIIEGDAKILFSGSASDSSIIELDLAYMNSTVSLLVNPQSPESQDAQE